MEHHEDNAQLDNYLQNRLAESLQISGGAGEHHLHLAAAAGSELSAPSIASPKADQKDDEDEDEEWKYIHEGQQSEKLQQHHQLTLANESGNGFGSDRHSEDLVVGNGAAAGLSLVYEEEDVEVIKNDGDFSTNSNTTTSTDEVVAQDQQQSQEAEKLAEQDEQQQLQSRDLHQEDEDEPSSVATTYGTSSLSENNPTPMEQEQVVLVTQTVNQEQPVSFANKENCDYVEELEENHSQLNPNAAAFVPSFVPQPSSPLSSIQEPLLGLHPRQMLPLDDLVAESPRKGSARDNMDAIAVPDEREFDIGADKRPHELEQESEIFGAVNLEMQLLNGVGTSEATGLEKVLDHGPETSVDMDLSLDQLPAEAAAIMKQSIYAEHNASIEDILNSVQPLPTQTGEEKEQQHVEEKEHVSHASTEELQFQHELQHEQHQQPLFNNSDPMQASFYLEHTSKDAQKEEIQELEQLPVESSDIFADQSLLLDTSAPQFSPESVSPLAKMELKSQQADVVDITPSPLSSTEEKHLIEDTKELIEERKSNHDFHLYEPISVGAVPQMEENAALNAAPGFEAQNEVDKSPAPQGINLLDQALTPSHPAGNQQEILHLQEDLAEEQYLSMPSVASKYFDLCDKVTYMSPVVDVKEPKKEQPDFGNCVPLEEKLGDGEKIGVEHFAPIKEHFAAPEVSEVPLSVTKENPLMSQIEETVRQSTELLVEANSKTNSEEKVLERLPEAVSVATITAIAVADAVNSNSTNKPEPTAAAVKPKPPAPAIKKTTTSSTSVAGANKAAAARPRTAPVATKTTMPATKPSSAAPPSSTTRKPLSSNVGSTAKPALKLSSTQTATSPVSKVALGAKATTSKPTPSGPSSAAGSGSGAKSSTRPSASTNARKPATNGPGSGTALGSTARRTASNASGTASGPSSAAATKSRLAVTSAAAARPKALSPRSTTSNTTTTVRKVPSTTATSLSTRSLTKPVSNGLGKSTNSSSTTTTTTATITKTFTARPAPKYSHSAASSISSGNTTRRLQVPSSSSATTAATLRKSSPSKASPAKAAPKPLTPKPKESATTKSSPVGLKAQKSAALKGATPIRAPEVAPPVESTSTINGLINAEEANIHNGNGFHNVEQVQPIAEQPTEDRIIPIQSAEEPLLDF